MPNILVRHLSGRFVSTWPQKAVRWGHHTFWLAAYTGYQNWQCCWRFTSPCSSLGRYWAFLFQAWVSHCDPSMLNSSLSVSATNTLRAWLSGFDNQSVKWFETWLISDKLRIYTIIDSLISCHFTNTGSWNMLKNDIVGHVTIGFVIYGFLYVVYMFLLCVVNVYGLRSRDLVSATMTESRMTNIFWNSYLSDFIVHILSLSSHYFVKKNDEFIFI